MLIRKPMFAMLALAAFFAGTSGLFRTLPAGFLPDEDQGVMFAAVRLPDGASLERTRKVMEQVEEIIRSTPGVKDITSLGGVDFTTSTNNSNVATVFASLNPWEERKAENLQLAGNAGAARQALQPDSRTRSCLHSACLRSWGLGNAGGFEFMLEDRLGGDTAQLAERRADG